MTQRAWGVWLVLAGVLGCARGREEGAQRNENAALGGDVAAKVGTSPIPLALVEAVARAKKVAPSDALTNVIDDEIAASSARARGLDRQLPASWRLRAVRGRFTSDHLFQEAKRRGPPTDEEIRVLSLRHWQEVDRPPAVRVIHAIVLRPKSAALLDRARALAQELHDAVASASDAGDFEAKARAAYTPPPRDPKAEPTALETRVERLPAFTDDGWVTEGEGRMAEPFARAAAKLRNVGDTSAVVESDFGWHTIRLLERIPEQRMPIETRKIAFAEEAYRHRAQELLSERLAALTAANPIEISPAAGQLMQSVTVSAAVDAP